MIITPLFTTHNTFAEGGNRTHNSIDDDKPACGTRIEKAYACTGESREVAPDDIEMHIDCRKCLAKLRKTHKP